MESKFIIERIFQVWEYLKNIQLKTSNKINMKLIEDKITF